MAAKLHLDALLLSLASSTDNFTVGFSIGFRGQRLPFWGNAFIAVANACGALVASWAGASLGKAVPSVAPLLASAAFCHLSIKELFAFQRQRREKQNDEWERTTVKDGRRSSQTIDSALALPMTLNNLAGGVAGGAMGLTVTMAAAYALVASLLTMAAGNFLGKHLGRQLSFDPTLLAALLLGVLCLLTLQEGIAAT